MNLHKAVADLIEAQNSHDSLAYTECFSGTAVVFDEAKTHTGKAEIRQWIERADREYHSVLKPLSYQRMETENVLTAEVYGKFPGSPAILQFHFVLENGLIQSLRITG